MSKPDGGNAFPLTGVKQFPVDGQPIQMVFNNGMSLRDYFAGEALSIAAQDAAAVTVSEAKELLGLPSKYEWDFNTDMDKLTAFLSYRLADAMLKAREL
jgi:hypothetical protein